MVVEEELDFFGIHLQKMIDDYDEMVAANNPILPPTMRESINNTVGLLFFIIYSIASSFGKLTFVNE